MSGGHFDYNCFKISQFAEVLEYEIKINDSQEVVDLGERRGYNFNPHTIKTLIEIQESISLAGKLAKEVEWLYSGDKGEESFLEIVTPLLQEHKAKTTVGSISCSEASMRMYHEAFGSSQDRERDKRDSE